MLDKDENTPNRQNATQNLRDEYNPSELDEAPSELDEAGKLSAPFTNSPIETLREPT